MREVLKIDIGDMSNDQLDSEFQKFGIATNYRQRSMMSHIMWVSFAITIGMLACNMIFIN